MPGTDAVRTRPELDTRAPAGVGLLDTHLHVLEVGQGENKNQATPLKTITLAKAGYIETKHLEEWLISNPRVLGEDVTIVTQQYFKWQSPEGKDAKDRFDILGIDSAGRLLIAEIKRGSADNHTDLQAIKYAALASRFDEDTLIDAHRSWLSKRRDSEVSREDAEEQLRSNTRRSEESDEEPDSEWLDPERLRQPRILLLARSFGSTIMSTVVWLSESGLDISVVQYQLYTVGGKKDGHHILVINQMYPTPDTEDFVLYPTRRDRLQSKTAARQKPREKNAAIVLCEQNALPPDTALRLVPQGLKKELRTELDAWFKENPDGAKGSWTAQRPIEAIRWDHTETVGSPSKFARDALKAATGASRSINGSDWWRTEGDERTVAEIAEEYRSALTATAGWSDLHELLKALPENKWTDCKDLADHFGIELQPLERHLVVCNDCPDDLQVLTDEGEPAVKYRDLDPTDSKNPRAAVVGYAIEVGSNGPVLDEFRKWSPSTDEST